VRWRNLTGVIHRRLAAFPPAEEGAADFALRISAADDAVAKAGQRLIQAGIVDEDAIGPPTVSAADEEAPPALHVLSSTAADELKISWPNREAGLPPPRALIAAAIAIAALLAWPVGRSVAVQEWFMAHAHFVLAAAGIAWWLIAPLGGLGWVLVLAAVWLSLRSPWPRASEPGSTLERLPRSQLR